MDDYWIQEQIKTVVTSNTLYNHTIVAQIYQSQSESQRIYTLQTVSQSIYAVWTQSIHIYRENFCIFIYKYIPYIFPLHLSLGELVMNVINSLIWFDV